MAQYAQLISTVSWMYAQKYLMISLKHMSPYNSMCIRISCVHLVSHCLRVEHALLQILQLQLASPSCF